MANPNFLPTISSDEVWRGQDTTRCVTDDLDNIEADIASIDTKISTLGNTYAALDHVHNEYAKTTDVVAVRDALSTKANKTHEHNEYASSLHNHDDAYYTQAQMNALLENKSDKTHSHPVDSALSDASTNPIQNKAVAAALADKVPVTTKVNGKPLSSSITLSATDVSADKVGSADAALATAKKYTDTSIADLIGSADTTMDTLGEIQAAMNNNADVVKALDDAIGKKADAVDLSAHIGSNVAHVTQKEKDDWNLAHFHSEAKHAPVDAQANQDAFSYISVGSDFISAKSEADTVSLEGNNIAIGINDTKDKIIVGLNNNGVIGALGYTPARSSHAHTAKEIGAAPEIHTHNEYLPISGGNIVGNLSIAGELGVQAPVALSDRLVMASDTAGIFGTHSNGNVYHQFQPVNGHGRCTIGYGMYSSNVGGTDIYGYNMSLISKGKVSVTGDLEITSKAAGLTDRAYGVNKVLWSGATYLHASQSVGLSEAVSAQPNGIVLVFSAYKVGTGATDTYWQHFFVPKYMIGKDHAGGTTFILEKSGILRKKYIYINDTDLKGSDVNDNPKYVFHGQTVDNREVVLRYVIGV